MKTVAHRSNQYRNYSYSFGKFDYTALGASIAATHTTTATPTARFEARISAELHAMLKRTAEI